MDIKSRRILLIYTGGTIGMIRNPKTGALDAFNFEHLQKNVPELWETGVSVQALAFEPPIDSSDMQPDLWARMATIVAENYTDFDGFVILHGTDTMAYTASALSFMLQDLEKPVILTGSQLPIGVPRTDGRENLMNAIELAAACDEEGCARVPEVGVCFGGKLLRGNRCTKTDCDSMDAFASFNCRPLATMGIHIDYADDLIRKPSCNRTFQVHTEWNSNVIAFTLFPGIQRRILEHVLLQSDLKGIVLRTFGSGNAPHLPWLLDALSEASRHGKVVVNITQCDTGRVQMGLYATGQQLCQAGVVSGGDMTVECAVTKLMCLFGRGFDAEAVRLLMGRSLAGELTVQE